MAKWSCPICVRPAAYPTGRTQEGMKTRSVTLKAYECGTIVLEVMTTELPVIVQAVVPEPERELAAA